MAKTTLLSDCILRLKCISEGECCDNVDYILSETLKFIVSDCDLAERVQAIVLVFSCVLPKISSEILESRLKELLTVTGSLFECSINTLHNTLQDIKQSICVLENASQIIVGLISCLDFLTSAELFSLNYVVLFLNILEKSYQHCSDCESFYKDALFHVRDTLQHLIMQCQNLQSKVIVYLDNIQENSDSLDNCASGALVDLMEGLFSVLRPLGRVLEIRSTVPIWRAYFKLLSKRQHEFLGQLNTAPVVTYLCSEVSNLLEQEILSNDSDNASKNLKICSFLFKLVVNLCDKFIGHLSSCVNDLIAMCLVLFKFAPSSLFVKDKLEAVNEIERTILIGVDPLIDCLLSEKAFASAVLQLDPHKNETLGLSRFYITILNLLPANANANVHVWFPKTCPSILSRLFQAFEFCSVECLLPIYLNGIMHKGKPEFRVSYYHFLCVNICGFVSSLSAELFQAIEPCLFGSLLCTNSFVSFLASDIICFIARFSTSDLTYAHCRYLIKVLCSMQKKNVYTFSVTSLHVRILLNRLFAFLNESHQRNILSEFSDSHIQNFFKSHFLKNAVSSYELREEFTSMQELNNIFDYLELTAKIKRILNEQEETFLLRLIQAVSQQSVPLVLMEYVLFHVQKVVLILKCFNKAAVFTELLHRCINKGSKCAQLLFMLFYWHLVRNSPVLESPLVSILARCAAIGLNAKDAWMQELAFERFAEISHPVLNEQLIRQALKMCSPKVTSGFKEYMKMYIGKEGTYNKDKRLELIKLVLDQAEETTEEPTDELVFDLTDLICETSADKEEVPLAKKIKYNDSVSHVLCDVHKVVGKLESECQNRQLDSTTQKEIQEIIERLKKLI